ncbi:MAG: transporter permease [Alphaproteobacteria bacterium]|jgi:peptide/nickel transport system permease protein|nr:transporter permease [Alphaproteobacteria bacterium]
MTSRVGATLHKIWDSDVAYSFRRSPVVVVAGVTTLLLFLIAIFAPLISPFDPLDLATIDLTNGLLPPAWHPDGNPEFVLGTDEQGRDMLSAIFYGLRLSLFVGFVSVLFAMALGITLGLISGYAGGSVDAVIMRAADVQLTFPAILVALLINGIARGIIGNERFDELAIIVVILAIGLSFWVQYARTVRGSVLVEKNKEYVQAAKVIGLHPLLILFRHILPNVMGPVLVIATINLALAIITEATLSFLGVGLPATTPSLGRLIEEGNRMLQEGKWWIAIMPSIALVILVLSVNLLGDWLRDALNPKLR